MPFRQQFPKVIGLDRAGSASYSKSNGEPFGFPLKGTNMNWETPSFEEIDMSAEIGSYQGEDDNGL